MTDPENFDLNALIDSVTDAAGPDPGDIAAKVEPLIPDAHRHAVMLLLLRRYIVSNRLRLGSVLAKGNSGHQRPSGRPAGKPGASTKVAALRDHARFLRMQVAVGRGATKWMGECTFDDLMTAASVRRIHAAQTFAMANSFETLANLLKKHGALTVEKLSVRVLDDFLASGWVK